MIIWKTMQQFSFRPIPTRQFSCVTRSARRQRQLYTCFAESPTCKRRDSCLARIVWANYPVSKSRAQLTSPDVKSDTRSKDSQRTAGACGGTYYPQLISKTLARLQLPLEWKMKALNSSPRRCNDSATVMSRMISKEWFSVVQSSA